VAKTALKDYFTTGGQRRALVAYAEFANGSAWSVPLKMELYDLSREALGVRGIDLRSDTAEAAVPH
jgi:hypothetical protein